MVRRIAERPWLLVIAAFIVLAAAWAVLIVVAERNKPEPIPVKLPGR
jgi:hypothetical protein